MLELKLKDNPKLRLYDGAASYAAGESSTVSDNFKKKTTGMMIDGCPNIDALSIFDAVSGYKTTHAGETGVNAISNIRIQLEPHNNNGTYYYSSTGNYDTLCKYTKVGSTSLSGYDSNGTAVSKPALVGTWGLTDYIDTTMADELTSTMFYTECPVVSADYIIDWDKVAVQSVDSTKPNYNPALSVILHSKGLGHVYENTDHFTGKWWITTAEASGIKDIGTWFKAVTGVDDTYGIVTTASAGGWKLSTLDSLSGFTGITTLAPSAFYGNADLVSARLPSNLREIPVLAFSDCTNLTSVGEMPSTLSSVQASAFGSCSKLESSSLGSGITEIEEGAFDGCKKVTFSTLPSNLRYVSNSAFKACEGITVKEIPSGVCYIGTDAFSGCTGMTDGIRLNRGKTATNILSGAFEGTSGRISVGDTDSSWLGEKLRRRYSSDVNVGAYSSRLSGWYKERYSSVIDSNVYEILDFIASDGISCMTPEGVVMSSDVNFISDISFCGTPANSGDSVHGTSEYGLVGKYGTGLVAKLGTETFTIRTSSDYDDGTVHNFWIDQYNKTIGMDWGQVYNSSSSATESKQISFFGNSTAKFIGSSWMNRIVSNGVVVHEYVPVSRISDNKLGFCDVKVDGTPFIEGGEYYTSNETQLGAMADSEYVIVTEDGDSVIL